MRWDLRFCSLMALTTLTIVGSCPIRTIAQDSPTPSISQRQCPLRYPAGKAKIADLQADLAEAQKAKDMASTGDILQTLGNIDRDLGMYSSALKAYNESFQIAKSIKSVELESGSIAGQAHIRLELGQYDQAIAGFEEALKLRRSMNVPRLEILSLNNLGIAYGAQGNPQKAQAAYQQALTIAAKNPPTRYTQWVRWNQANLKFATTDDVADFSQDRPGFTPINQLDPSNYGALMNNLALVHEADGHPDEALKAYAKALESFVQMGNFSCEQTVLRNQGRLLAQQGEIARAILTYYNADGRTFLVLLDRDLPSTEKASYRSLVTPLYQEFAALLKQQGRDQDAQMVLKQLAQ
jgi:tetratricopeptide (TPR) repeat protein